MTTPLQISDILRHYENQTIAARDTHELEGALTTVINLRWTMLRSGEKTFRVRGMRSLANVTPRNLQEMTECLFRILNTRYGCDGMTRQ